MGVFLGRLDCWWGVAAGAVLLAIFVRMMLLSAGRPIGLNIPADDDFVSWCMAAMAFLGLAHTFRNGEMIRVGLLGQASCAKTAVGTMPKAARDWRVRRREEFIGCLVSREGG